MIEGWKNALIEDHIKFIDYRGRTPKKTGKGMRLITAKNVKMGFLQLEPQEFVDPGIYEEWMTRGIPKKGDILFTTEAPLGNVAQLDTDNKVVFAQRVIIMQPNRDVLKPTFLKYMLLSEMLQTKLHENATGATAKGIKASLLKKIPITYPPLPEQKRIVAILDETIAGISQAVANSEKNLANARELFESYLNKVFTEKGEGWEEKTLGEVCSFQGGSQPPKSDFSTKLKGGYIRLIQIRDYKTDKHTVYIPKEKARRFCSAEDVMIGRYGPPLFQILRGIDGAYNVALMKADPNEKFIGKDYLYYFLKNGKILQYIINASNRAAGQIGLNKATLETYCIPFPCRTKQSEIVLALEDLQKKIQHLSTIYQKKITALAELKQSILQKAFAGELTTDTVQQQVNA